MIEKLENPRFGTKAGPARLHDIELTGKLNELIEAVNRLDMKVSMIQFRVLNPPPSPKVEGPSVTRST